MAHGCCIISHGNSATIIWAIWSSPPVEFASQNLLIADLSFANICCISGCASHFSGAAPSASGLMLPVQQIARSHLSGNERKTMSGFCALAGLAASE